MHCNFNYNFIARILLDYYFIWLEFNNILNLQTNSCPFCRHEMPTDDENYEAYKKAKKRAEQSQNDLDALHNSMFS